MWRAALPAAHGVCACPVDMLKSPLTPALMELLLPTWPVMRLYAVAAYAVALCAAVHAGTNNILVIMPSQCYLRLEGGKMVRVGSFFDEVRPVARAIGGVP